MRDAAVNAEGPQYTESLGVYGQPSCGGEVEDKDGEAGDSDDHPPLIVVDKLALRATDGHHADQRAAQHPNGGGYGHGGQLEVAVCTDQNICTGVERMALNTRDAVDGTAADIKREDAIGAENTRGEHIRVERCDLHGNRFESNTERWRQTADAADDVAGNEDVLIGESAVRNIVFVRRCIEI